MKGNIVVETGDITRIACCAIVNAANSSCMGGGGVDGAIHRAGGPRILEECRTIRKERYPDGLPTAEAVATTAGDLPARYVIHTVGPIYPLCEDRCDALLAAAYRNALHLAKKLGCDCVAFPAISTGAYGFPAERAARIAYTSVRDALRTHKMKVVFCFHNEEDAALFRRVNGLDNVSLTKRG